MANHGTVISVGAGLCFCMAAVTIIRSVNSSEPAGMKVSLGSPSQKSPPATKNSGRGHRSRDGTFRPIPEPGPTDWLANHIEEGQPFEEFLHGERNTPGSTRTCIYLQPLWEIDSVRGPPLSALREFTSCYFRMPVKLLPTLFPPMDAFAPRKSRLPGLQSQVHAGRALEFLNDRVPEDAFCVAAVTMADLYPDTSWNFVFGYASYTERVGIFSFARYDPALYGSGLTAGNGRLLLKRCCKILAHETGHMFGMAHCIRYHCVMNGSNHLGESDAQPLHLCPDCLRKLQHGTGFEISRRYHDLQAFYRKGGFEQEAQWVNKRLERMEGDDVRESER